jgi:hypothetical protein
MTTLRISEYPAALDVTASDLLIVETDLALAAVRVSSLYDLHRLSVNDIVTLNDPTPTTYLRGDGIWTVMREGEAPLTLTSIADWTSSMSTIGDSWKNNTAYYAAINSQTVVGSHPTRSIGSFITKAYAGCVLLTDGTVFLVPHNETVAAIINPHTQDIKTVAGFPGQSAYYGGVLLKSGRVFCIPYNHDRAKVYDPASDTVSSCLPIFNGSYCGGVLLADGRVACIPTLSSNPLVLYDETTDTAATKSFSEIHAYRGGVAIPDGRLVCIPSAGGLGAVYDPVADSFSLTPPWTDGNETLLSGVLLTDGRVLGVPNAASVLPIYDPEDNSISQMADLSPTEGYAGGVLLPNGQVFLVPGSATSAAVYDPATQALLDVGGNYTESYRSGVLLSDGQVFCAPDTALTARIHRLTHFWTKVPSLRLLTSPYVNHL